MLRPTPGPGMAHGLAAQIQLFPLISKPFITRVSLPILVFVLWVVSAVHALPESRDRSMRPVRISSEGPEVIPKIPDRYFAPYTQGDQPRDPKATQYQKQVDQIPLFPPPPTGGRSVRREPEQQQSRYRRPSGSLFTILLAIGAFLLGGGIGGGIGGAFIAKDRSKISM